MPNKTFISIASSIVFLVAVGSPAMAVTTPADRMEKIASKAADKQQDRLAKIIDRGNKAIDERLGRLTTLSTKIGNNKFLTADQKTSLANDIQAENTALTTLKTKLDADTDVATALADYKKIFTDYRIFAVFVPKMQAMVVINRINKLIDTMTTFGTKLADRINTAKAAGKNTAALDAQLTQYQADLTKAKASVASASALLPDLTPDKFPATMQTLKTIRTDLRDAHADLMTAHQLGKQMVKELRALNPASGSASKSASPSSTASASATP